MKKGATHETKTISLDTSSYDG